jgi:hypothetical protein
MRQTLSRILSGCVATRLVGYCLIKAGFSALCPVDLQSPLRGYLLALDMDSVQTLFFEQDSSILWQILFTSST